MDISEKIRAYHGVLAGNQHHRYRSWEHCYAYFRRVTPASIVGDRDTAALQLAFYLASGGMYRGSSFLLQHAHSVHLKAVDCLASPRFAPLWSDELGVPAADVRRMVLVLDAAAAIRSAYSEFGNASDIVVTKVMLGTFGSVPACDRFFVDGFTIAGLKYRSFNGEFIERLLTFSRENLAGLRQEQARIQSSSGAYYPLMKLVDMYFWQTGYEAYLEK